MEGMGGPWWPEGVETNGSPNDSLYMAPLKVHYEKRGDCEMEKKSSATLVLLNVFSFFTSEKHKAEMRDRKVLEILQFKDHMIEELEQVWYGFSWWHISSKIIHLLHVKAHQQRSSSMFN